MAYKCKEKANEQARVYRAAILADPVRRNAHLKRAAEKSALWRIRYPDGAKEYREQLKARVRAKLGEACKHCGFSDIRALQIDHVFGGGNAERKKFGSAQPKLYKRVLADTEGKYQLLCANCNWIKRYENKEAIYNGRNR